jgi:hypothetical protein
MPVDLVPMRGAWEQKSRKSLSLEPVCNGDFTPQASAELYSEKEVRQNTRPPIFDYFTILFVP